jgi:hypothetical protein
MIHPDDLPPHDLLDTKGHLKRGAVALAVAIALGSAAYLACSTLFEPGHIYAGSSMSGKFKFLAFFTAVAGGIGFWVTRAALQHVADKRWRQELVPRAQARTRSTAPTTSSQRADQN